MLGKLEKVPSTLPKASAQRLRQGKLLAIFCNSSAALGERGYLQT
jgi:hypothetical protein